MTPRPEVQRLACGCERCLHPPVEGIFHYTKKCPQHPGLSVASCAVARKKARKKHRGRT